mmetsp:Transcript_8144/g.17452  ORF Transcript_8144/g.17452 Transcript_8144/m.17452 type:complete len:264 (+) Transcript_8144:106-897(+)
MLAVFRKYDCLRRHVSPNGHGSIKWHAGYGRAGKLYKVYADLKTDAVVSARSSAASVASIINDRLGLKVEAAERLCQTLATEYSSLLVDEEAWIPQLSANLDLLCACYPSGSVLKLILGSEPILLAQDLPAWFRFFVEGYGMKQEDFYLLMRHSPSVLLGNTPFTAGSSLLFLRTWGISDEDVVQRIIPYYPQVLAMGEERLKAVVDQLMAPGLLEGEESVRRLLRECPGVLLPDLWKELRPITERIRASRAGKYASSGSYWI